MICSPGQFGAASVGPVPSSDAVGAPLRNTSAAAKQSGHIPRLAFCAVFSLSILARPLLAQTIDTGSVVGTVSDPTGAVISGADVTITNVATGRVIALTTNASGVFNSGALVPGNYETQVSAKGFSIIAVTLPVLVGNTATVNVRLKNHHSCHPLFFSSLLLGRRRGIRASNLSNLALMSRTRHASPIGIASVTALVMAPKSPSSEGRESRRAMATIKR